MTDDRLHRRAVMAGLAGMAGATVLPARSLAQAAAWPQKGSPPRLIVPFAPAGATDNLARILAQRLGDMWGVQLVIENRGGAGANIGTELVKRAAPDGNTFLIVSVSMATNPFLYAKLGYDPVADFAPVTLMAMVPNILIAGTHVKANSVAELIEEAKAAPGRMTYGSGGIGTSVHLAGELFQRMTGTKLVHVPYRGSAQAMQDLLGGRVDIMFDNISQSLPQARAGAVKALGITTLRASPLVPELKPVAETIPGFDVTSWFALFFPAGTPKEIVAKLETDTREALRDAGVRERMAALGAEPVGGTPDELAAFLRAETEKWGKLIREAGIKME